MSQYTSVAEYEDARYAKHNIRVNACTLHTHICLCVCVERERERETCLFTHSLPDLLVCLHYFDVLILSYSLHTYVRTLLTHAYTSTIEFSLLPVFIGRKTEMDNVFLITTAAVSVDLTQAVIRAVVVVVLLLPVSPSTRTGVRPGALGDGLFTMVLP